MTSSISLRAELLAAGICRHVIDGDLRAQRTVAPFRGVHVANVDLSLLDRWQAAHRVQRGDAWLSHRSSAVANGLAWLPEKWRRADAVVDMTLPPGVRRRQRDGLHLTWRELGEPSTTIGGLPVTPPARTLIDLVRDDVVSWQFGVALMDGALRFGSCTLDELELVAAGVCGRGCRKARSAVEAARLGVDSPGETQTRLALIAGGVPAASLQVPVSVVEDGILLARGDFGNEDLMLWGEHDGFDVHTQREVFNYERPHRRWLEGRGWQVMAYVAEDARHPVRSAREWLAAMAAAPARILAMDPSRSPELARAQQRLLAAGASRPTRLLR